MMPKILLACLSLAVTGCAELAYYRQAVEGHLDLMARRQPLDRVLQRPDLDTGLARQLETVRELRTFAAAELALPVGDSYGDYVALERPYAVYNLVAAPEFGLEPYRWCYPLIGCAAYRGYYRRADAEAAAADLAARGYDTFVAGVAAYSTLGWFDDPLLSSFIHWPEGLLAELLFHELAHRRFFLAGDTTFNESYATVVGEAGAERWLWTRPRARAEYRRYRGYRGDFRALLAAGRERLEALYAADRPAAAMRIAKRRLLAELLGDYRRLQRECWDGFAGYDRWVGDGFNNAKLASLRAYTEHVPALRALLREVGGDFAAFHAAVAALGEQSARERARRLVALSAAAEPAEVAVAGGCPALEEARHQ